MRKLRRNKDIVIVRLGEGNGVVVMDRVIYNQQMYALLSDKNNFKKLRNHLKIQQPYGKDSYRDT